MPEQDQRTRTFAIIARCLFAVIVLADIAALTFIGMRLRDRYSAQTAGITILNKAAVVRPIDNSFAHFTEPTPSSTVEFMALPEWLDATPRMTINHDSLNERRDYPVEKPPGTYRIVTLGDSWTFGQYVDTPLNWPERLEDLLNESASCAGKQFEVINLGVPGYDIQFAVERFRRRGVKYDPDLVVWLFISNDFDEVAEFIEGFASEELAPTRNQHDAHPLPRSALTASISAAYMNAHRTFAEQLSEPELMKFQANALTKINAYYSKPLVLTWLSGGGPLPQTYVDVLSRFANERGDTLLFDNSTPLSRPETLLPDTHPNPAGHEKIAQSLFRYLAEQRLTPCALP